MRRLILPAAKKGSPPRGQLGRGRKRAQPIWRAPWLLGGLAASVFVASLGASWWGWRSGVFQQAFETARWEVIAHSSDFGFRVQDIQVTGRTRTDRDAILDAVRIAEGAPILAFDAEAARKRIEALPWVHSAVVERRLPDTIFLHLTERRPAALWQHEGRFRLIDGEGTVILEDEVGAFGELMMVVGAGAPDRLASLLVLLETEPVLKGRVRSATRVGGRRWNVWLDAGTAEAGKRVMVEVLLPEIGAAEAWQQLARYQEEKNLFARDVRVIDLRLSDRITIRPWATQPRPGVGQPALKRET